MSEHAQNLICEIKPSDYKMARFMASTTKLLEKEGHVGHLLEAVWKLIAYCEILQEFRLRIERRPIQVDRSIQEQEFWSFYDQFEHLIREPFERKLMIAAKWLEEVQYDGDNFTQKVHDEFLSKAKSVLVPLMKRVHRTVILIDNLDKSWTTESDLWLQAHLVFSLMGLHRRLSADFGAQSDVSVLIFLRRNILEYILKLEETREPDKLLTDTIEMAWNDKDMLMRVIEERFNRAVFGKRDVEPGADPWVEYSGFAVEQVLLPWLPRVVTSFMGTSVKWRYKRLAAHVEEQLGLIDNSEVPSTREALAILVEVGFLGADFGEKGAQFATSIRTSRSLVERVRHNQSKGLLLVIHPVFATHLLTNYSQEDDMQSRTHPIEKLPWFRVVARKFGF